MFLSIQRRAWYDYLLYSEQDNGTYSQENEQVGKFLLQLLQPLVIKMRKSSTRVNIRHFGWSKIERMLE